MPKTLPNIDTDKPVFFIDDVDCYYEDSEGDVLFWDSDEMPDVVLSMECEYRRIRGVYSEPRGPINVTYLASAIEAQDGGAKMQPLEVIQAIAHSERQFTIDKTDDAATVARQLLALARYTAKREILDNSEGFLPEQETALKREKRTSELLMNALMAVLGHQWTDNELQAALTTEAATTIAPGGVALIGGVDEE